MMHTIAKMQVMESMTTSAVPCGVNSLQFSPLFSGQQAHIAGAAAHVSFKWQTAFLGQSMSFRHPRIGMPLKRTNTLELLV
jgi:hypothetical protein